jgi:hypothetical protein
MLCSKPGCARAGAALLSYDYAAQTALLHDPHEGELSPHAYTLCGICAGKLRPPRGWILQDRRGSPPLFVDDPEKFLAVTRIEPVGGSGGVAGLGRRSPSAGEQVPIDEVDGHALGGREESPAPRSQVRRIFFGYDS